MDDASLLELTACIGTMLLALLVLMLPVLLWRIVLLGQLIQRLTKERDALIRLVAVFEASLRDCGEKAPLESVAHPAVTKETPSLTTIRRDLCALSASTTSLAASILARKEVL